MRRLSDIFLVVRFKVRLNNSLSAMKRLKRLLKTLNYIYQVFCYRVSKPFSFMSNSRNPVTLLQVTNERYDASTRQMC